MKTIFAMGCVALLSGCPGDPMAGTITVGAVLSLTGELADIGVARHEIESVAQRCVQRR